MNKDKDTDMDLDTEQTGQHLCLYECAGCLKSRIKFYDIFITRDSQIHHPSVISIGRCGGSREGVVA
jgi:hypothetical protein